MRSNKSLLRKKEQIEKAMISIPAHLIVAEEADRFLDYVIEECVLKNNCRIVKMNKEERNIDAIGLGTGRILHPAGTFSSADYKKEFASNRITLHSQKLRGCVIIHDDDLENIDIETPQEFTDHILRMVAAEIANELEEIGWISDKHNLSGFAANDSRSLWDGWRYIITHSQSGQDYYNEVSGGAFILDATSDFLLPGKIAEQKATAPYNWEYKYSKALRTMPSKYKKGGLANMRFMHSDLVEQDYLDALIARATALGDAVITGKAGENYAFGKVPLISVYKMNTDLDANGKAGAGSFTDSVLTHYLNFIMGLQRELKIETERQASDEANYFFYSIKADFKMENVNAVVLIKKLTTG